MGLLGWAARIGTDRLFIVQSAITVQQVITVNTEIAAHECLWRLPKTVFTISTNGIRSMQDAECHYSHPMDIVAIFAHKESSLSDPFCSGLRVSRARWCGTASHSSALLDSRIICVSPPTRSPSPPWHRSRANWGTMEASVASFDDGQRAAWSTFLKGANVAILGAAGFGKSRVLQECIAEARRSYGPKVVLVMACT